MFKQSTADVKSPAHPRRGTFKRIFNLLLVGTAALVFIILPLRYFAREQQKVSPDLRRPYRLGTMSGVPLAIPSNHVRLAVEYIGESVWKKQPNPPPVHTQESRIAHFNVHLTWPGLQVHRPWAMSFTPENKDWLIIGVTVRDRQETDFSKPMEVDPHGIGLAKVLRHRLSGELPELPAGVSFHLEGENSALGLQIAKPVGLNTERYNTWNDVIYWKGDPEGIVSTYISCDNGAFLNLRIVRKCNHKYVFPELRAYVWLTYPYDFLPQWKALEEKSREVILSYEKLPVANQ